MFEINRDDEDFLTATDGDKMVTVLDKGGMFHRRAIRKHLKTGETEQINCLVCELDGVRLYIKDNSIILTKQDIYL